MEKTGINMEHVRKQNRSLILHTINRKGPLSRKDLSELTKLTAASITVTTNALLKEGILKEAGTVSDKPGAGRHKVLLDLNAEMFRVCTVNIEAEETTLALCDCKGRLLSGTEGECLKRIPTERTLPPREFLKKTAGLCRQMMNSLPEEEKKTIQCVSVGITGSVDRENAVSVRAFGVWKEKTEVGKILTGELGLPVLLQNNVDAFAQAELLYGVGRTKSNLLIIKWGPGVGGTVVINDQIYEGRHGRSAEIGHYIVDPRGERCGCGRRGCLETVVSYKALQKTLSFPAGGLGEAYEEAPEIKRDAIREKIRLFARCIVNTGTTLAPDRIILCGSLFRGENIREELISACQEYDPAYSSKRIVYTSLSGKEGYIGPLAVFAEELLISGGMSAIH